MRKILEDVLNGELNIDHKGVTRWRYIHNSETKYFSKQDLEDYFNSILEKMENIIESLNEDKHSPFYGLTDEEKDNIMEAIMNNNTPLPKIKSKSLPSRNKK